jgi:hypothetical protein
LLLGLDCQLFSPSYSNKKGLSANFQSTQGLPTFAN